MKRVDVGRPTRRLNTRVSSRTLRSASASVGAAYRSEVAQEQRYQDVELGFDAQLQRTRWPYVERECKLAKVPLRSANIRKNV